MHNYYPWLSNDVSYNGQFSPFHYPKPPPFTYSPNAYHHPFNDAGHNPFLGTSNNPIQFHDNRYLRIHSNSLPGYWNPLPTPDHPGNEEFRRRGNTIYIIKRRPRVRRKSRHRKTNYGSSGGHTMHIRNNLPLPRVIGIGQQASNYSAGKASCGMKADEAQFVKTNYIYGSGGGHTMHIRNNNLSSPPSGGEQLSFSVGRACGIKPDEDESGSESESEEEVVEEEYEEEYECPYAYVDSNGKINKLQNAPN